MIVMFMKDFEVSGLCPLSNTSKLSRSSTRFQSLPANCTLPWVQGWPELERINIKRKATHVGCVTRSGCLGLVDVFSHVFVLSGASRLCGPQEALRRCSRRDRTSGGRHPRALQPLTILPHFSVKFIWFLKHISCEIWPPNCFNPQHVPMQKTNTSLKEIQLQPRTMASSFWRAVT